jgi:threonylcarbamoyladenosine tRNA methylthiotransferase MtaB
MARGPSRSRPLAAVLDEARRLVDHGHREVVLTGVHLGRYGLDLGLRLADAVRAVLRTPGLERLRLSSIEALEVTPELLSVFGEDARLCPHLHLPMQSGDDAVLRAMNRGYTIRAFLDVVEEARRRLARPALTTDLMVGFPGETEAQFQNSLRACGEAGFSRVHVFRFSPRPGTPAAAMPGQVRPEAAADREARCLDIARDLALRYKLAFLGQVVEPLVETTRDRETGRLTGMTERYVSVRFAGPDALMNRIARVRISGATPETIEGEHVND